MTRPGPLIFTTFLLFLLLFPAPPEALFADPGREEILIIFSYDSWDKWSQSVSGGLMEELGVFPELNFHFEYLDTRNIQEEAYLSRYRALLAEKYHTNQPDLIVACDDAAFAFALKLRSEFRELAPLVFCGVNDADPASWAGSEKVTGVNEAVDIAGTVNSALRLFPATRKIAVVTSSGVLGSINLELYHDQKSRFSHEVETIELIDYDTSRLSSLLPALGEETIVLRLDNIRNAGGHALSLRESIGFLAGYSSRPVFTCWDFDMGEGAFGGLVVSGRQQGREAGKTVVRILEGDHADNIPVMMKSPNAYIFDYRQMKRYNIEARALPSGSVIINRPQNLLYQYRYYFISTALVLTLLLLLTAGLSLNLRGRKRAETALKRSEERLRFAMEASRAGLWDWNMQSGEVYWGPRSYTMLGYEPDQFLLDYESWKELVHPDDREKVDRTIKAILEAGEGKFAMEFRYRNSEGGYQWIAGKGEVIEKDADGKAMRMTGTHMEISERKKAEEQLLHSLNEKEVLLRELYHRTKNNMQVIASLLSLKQGSIQDSYTAEVLKDLESKIYTMSLVHQMLYQSKNLNRIDLGEYCRELCTLTLEAFSGSAQKVSILYDISPVEVGLDSAVPLGLIVNELLTNAIKYAFRGRNGGEIRIGLRAPGTLTIADNGSGMPADVAQREASTLGLPTVRELVEGQLGGSITLDTSPEEGTIWTIVFGRE